VADLAADRPLSQHLTAIDRALEGRGFAARIRSRIEDAAVVEIVPFEPRHAADFKRLNIDAGKGAERCRRASALG
jgi:hypothetical protein